MRVKILETHLQTASSTSVRFSSDHGDSVGRWHSDMPESGREYDVEVEVPGVLEWGRDVVASSKTIPSISTTHDAVQICGVLELAHEDGVVTLRIGSSLLLVETQGQPPPAGTCVCMTVSHIDLYETRI